MGHLSEQSETWCLFHVSARNEVLAWLSVWYEVQLICIDIVPHHLLLT